jgi:hypothetical protein
MNSGNANMNADERAARWNDIDAVIEATSAVMEGHGIENVAAFVLLYHGYGAEQMGYEAVGDPDHAMFAAADFLAMEAHAHSLSINQSLVDLLRELATRIDASPPPTA